MSIEKSESGSELSRYTAEERMGAAMKAVDKALTKTSSENSSPIAKKSKTHTRKRCNKLVTTSTNVASGENIAKGTRTKRPTSELVAAYKSDPQRFLAERSELMVKANNGDLDAYEAVFPELENVYDGLSVMAKTLRKSMVERFAGQEKRVTQIIMARDIKKVECSLLDCQSSPLERLLAERVALCQSTLEFFEIHYMQNPNMSVSYQMLCQNRISMAQSRLVQAVKALAQVRKLQIPNLQVNIAEKQVNVS